MSESSAANATDGLAGGPQAASTDPVFECGLCHRRFSRVDHLSRHVRTRKYRDRMCSRPALTTQQTRLKSRTRALCAANLLRERVYLGLLLARITN